MHDLANADLLQRIPLTARSVLDVGCGTGRLGAAYRRLNPRARLLGIERNLEAATRAALCLDQVIAADVENQPVCLEWGTEIDCIVYGNVLEYLDDPWEVLRRQAALLSPSGTMLIRVPNVEHCNSCPDPPGERPGARKARSLSFESMRSGLTTLGLVPRDVHPVAFDQASATRSGATDAARLNVDTLDPAAPRSRDVPKHYVWRVQSRARPTMSVAATMLRPVGGVSDVRVVYPMQAMASETDVAAEIMHAPAFRPIGFDGPRIFVFHRPLLGGAWAVDLIRGLTREGFLLVTEFDDHPDLFEEMREADQMAFSGVHAVQTTTAALADILRLRNPEVAVFPNAIPALPDIANFVPGRPPTIFFGALNREQDWLPFLPVLNEMAAEADTEVAFSIVHDRALFDALRTSRKTFTPTCDYPTYLSLLGRCEISLMPLVDTPFNRAKSDLKFIEAGACRVTPLASRVVYAASITEGRTGVMFSSPDELREKLLQLLAMPHLARGIADGARDHVARQRMLAYQVAPRLAWYRSLWQRRAALTKALTQRVPALGSLAC